ncbi:hypothetical protein I3842_Q092100 [Carya illinoinensis]|uniref:B-like cyclin n=1 Tax=Carya illinoinensis TaxID=32201 RepID=A0A922D085_CARIL|nr:hypothetical protein I3842_Q092100 [Carya illinoinensis]
MASRHVPPQPKDGGKQQKNDAPGARNRRALGDIGNVVNIRGIEGKPNRPITRSFCAQLLANAQLLLLQKIISFKQVCVNVDGAPLLLDGPPQKKAIVKPKAEEVIVISPDTRDDVTKAKLENPGNKKNDGGGLSRKKAHALRRSLLLAACGLTKKPKEKIVDIDAADAGNELAALEYVEDIYKFYKLVENESHPHDYIDSQPEINESMRGILVDWLIDVHRKFELSLETLYLTINIIDRFLAIKTVPRKELQLVGIGAMLMASKYEEIWPPEVDDFVHLSDSAYTNKQILVMEKIILGKLEWTLTVPTPYVFLVRFIKASLPDQELENMVYFLAELGMMHYATIMHCPSMIAASAVYAARCTVKRIPAWNETLKLHTGFSEPQLIDCAKLLVSFHSTATKSRLQAVYRKYSNSERGSVALLSPAKALLPCAL